MWWVVRIRFLLEDRLKGGLLVRWNVEGFFVEWIERLLSILDT